MKSERERSVAPVKEGMKERYNGTSPLSAFVPSFTGATPKSKAGERGGGA